MARRKSQSTSSSGFSVREKLDLFVFRAGELAASRLLRDLDTSYSMTFSSEHGMSWEGKDPDEDDLRSFLVLFRPFISDKEPIHIFHIFNLCQQHLRSEILKGELIKARQGWIKEATEGSTGGRLVYNDRELTPEFLTDLWINGWYFHTDAEKYRALRSVLEHERFLIRRFFLNHLAAATNHILFIAAVINAASHENLFDV